MSAMARSRQWLTYFIFKVSNMLNKLHGQPESYDRKYVKTLHLPSLGLIKAACAEPNTGLVRL